MFLLKITSEEIQECYKNWAQSENNLSTSKYDNNTVQAL